MINESGTMSGGGGRPRGGRMCLGSQAPRALDASTAAAELEQAAKDLDACQKVGSPMHLTWRITEREQCGRGGSLGRCVLGMRPSVRDCMLRSERALLGIVLSATGPCCPVAIAERGMRPTVPSLLDVQ